EKPREPRGRIDAGRALHEPSPDRHPEADDEEEPEHVEHGLVEEVERALQELVAEERQGDVPVERGQHRAHEQGEEAPEHDRVHDSGGRLRQGPYLTERVGEHAADPLGDPIPPILGQTAPPQHHALPHPVGEDRDRDDAADVERDLRPAWDVPEGVAEGNGRGHERPNLSTSGRAEEDADRASSAHETAISESAVAAAPPAPAAAVGARGMACDTSRTPGARSPSPPPRWRSGPWCGRRLSTSPLARRSSSRLLRTRATSARSPALPWTCR